MMLVSSWRGAGIARWSWVGLAVLLDAASWRIVVYEEIFFPVEGIFPLELTWVLSPFPKKLFRMRV